MPSDFRTAYLGLNQWQGNEHPKRIDFVEDNQKIDAAVQAAQEKAAEALEAAKSVEAAPASHITDPMPHIATDTTGKKIRWGLKPVTVNGTLTVAFVYEEMS